MDSPLAQAKSPNQTKAKQKKRKEKESKLTWVSCDEAKRKLAKGSQQRKRKKKKKEKKACKPTRPARPVRPANPAGQQAQSASKPNRPASPAHLCPLTNCMPCFCTALHMIMALWSPKKRGVFFFSFLDSSSSRWRKAETPF